MNLSNAPVRHKLFGKGRIHSCENNIVFVEFDACSKKFVFPDVFKTHLALDGEREKAYIDSLFRKEAEQKQKQIDVNKRQTETAKLWNSLPRSNDAQAAFGFVQNKVDDVKNSWTLTAGHYLTGNHRGLPKPPARMFPNSACLLTTLPKGGKEDRRYIFGACMPDVGFIGSDCKDGIIRPHPQFKILLNPEESRELLFWEYLAPSQRRSNWGRTEILYFSNETMPLILSDICLLEKDEEKRQLCEEFLDYYCSLNKINKKRIPNDT